MAPRFAYAVRNENRKASLAKEGWASEQYIYQPNDEATTASIGGNCRFGQGRQSKPRRNSISAGRYSLGR